MGLPFPKKRGNPRAKRFWSKIEELRNLSNGLSSSIFLKVMNTPTTIVFFVEVTLWQYLSNFATPLPTFRGPKENDIPVRGSWKGLRVGWEGKCNALRHRRQLKDPRGLGGTLLTNSFSFVFKDIDEFIIPHKHLRWRDMIAEVEARNLKISTKNMKSRRAEPEVCRDGEKQGPAANDAS